MRTSKLYNMLLFSRLMCVFGFVAVGSCHPAVGKVILNCVSEKAELCKFLRNFEGQSNNTLKAWKPFEIKYRKADSSTSI